MAEVSDKTINDVKNDFIITIYCYKYYNVSRRRTSFIIRLIYYRRTES